MIDTFTITKSEDEITQPIGGGNEPTSVTFLYDSFNQEEGKYIARFNWVTPITTKTTQNSIMLKNQTLKAMVESLQML